MNEEHDAEARADNEAATDAHPLSLLLERVEESARAHEQVSVGHVLDALGHRTYAPLLLVPGLVMFAPIIGDIPGVPTLMGVLIIITAVQLLFRRDHIWLPEWLLNRSVGQGKVCRTVGWLRPAARFLDRWSRPRMTWVERSPGVMVIAVACIVLSAATPVMELVPFSANIAGAAVILFGLALIAEDGLIALLGLTVTVLTFLPIVYVLLL